MRNIYFNLFKWTIIIWCTVVIIGSITIAILSHKIADQWFKHYYANHTIHNKSDFNGHRNLTNNGGNYSEISTNITNKSNNDFKTENEEITLSYKSAFTVVIVFVAIIGGKHI